MYVLDIDSFHTSEFHLLLMNLPYTSFSFLLVNIKFSCLHMLRSHFHTQMHFDPLTFALQMSNDYIILYHKDAKWSVGFTQTNYSHPDCLFIQSLIHITYLFHETFNKTGPHVCPYVMFFLGGALHTSGYTLWPDHAYTRSFWCQITLHCHHLSHFVDYLC